MSIHSRSLASAAFLLGCSLVLVASLAHSKEPVAPIFNRAPLQAKPYAELPLGSIQPEGWLQDELQRMAGGMTGHLDTWYPEVCGDRNAWLGGDGDTWERGPYWIDGLYPLAKLLHDEQLEAKAQRWIEWTLANQREDGYIGPIELKPEDRTQPPPPGAQIHKPDDWWPRMVMLKILQQHYQATGDERVIDCLTRYFRYQLKTLPDAPLYDPGNPRSGSWWAAQRGGDNMMSVLWLYNITGEPFLLELAELLHEQTVPATEWFVERSIIPYRGDQGEALHCVNLAMLMKTPIIRYQQDPSPVHLQAVAQAFDDIRRFHGQPHGLYGGDEAMHGDAPDRGSELCSAVEMMFSLEKMVEITGDVEYADRLERIAFNALPTQCTDDYRARQYFQQTNQVQCTHGDRDFFNDNGDRVVYGLLRGYPCCTCNLHQGWPKFAQHLWMAAQDGGIAAIAYAPSSVTAQLGGEQVTLRQGGGYPFHEEVVIDVATENPAEFPLHLRVPGWCENASIDINGEKLEATPEAGTMHVVTREWKDGDRVTLRLPMPMRTSYWISRNMAIERGPLVFALDIPSEKREVGAGWPKDVPRSAMHRGYIEYTPTAAWNYAIPRYVEKNLDAAVSLRVADAIPDNPWTSESAPIVMTTHGLRVPEWTMARNSASNPPLSPVSVDEAAEMEEIRLIPYGSTTLRVAVFPVAVGGPPVVKQRGLTITASHVFGDDNLKAVHDDIVPAKSNDKGKPRHTFWPHLGTNEWLQYSFDRPREVTSVGVLWFDDTGDGQCRGPKSWRLLYRDGGEWRPVEARGAYGVELDRMNTVDFKPVTTDAIRAEATLQDGFSGGVLEWTFE